MQDSFPFSASPLRPKQKYILFPAPHLWRKFYCICYRRSDSDNFPTTALLRPFSSEGFRRRSPKCPVAPISPGRPNIRSNSAANMSTGFTASSGKPIFGRSLFIIAPLLLFSSGLPDWFQPVRSGDDLISPKPNRELPFSASRQLPLPT
jgi:hypothetical protein